MNLLGHLKEKNMISQFKMVRRKLLQAQSVLQEIKLIHNIKIADDLRNNSQSVVWNLEVHKVTFEEKNCAQQDINFIIPILKYFYFKKARSFGHLKEKSMTSQFKMTKNEWLQAQLVLHEIKLCYKIKK